MSDLINRKALIKEILDTYEYEYPTASGAFDKFVTQIIPNIIKRLAMKRERQTYKKLVRTGEE